MASNSGHPRMTADYPTPSSGQSQEQQGLKEKAQEMASNVGEAAGHMKERAQEFARGSPARPRKPGKAHAKACKKASPPWDTGPRTSGAISTA